MQNRKATLEREKTFRMQVLEKVRLSSCVDGFDIDWFLCSRDILQENSIKPYVYTDAIRDLLIHEYNNFSDVMITGRENCGKTLILKPLEIIYNALSNPVNDNMPWLLQIMQR